MTSPRQPMCAHGALGPERMPCDDMCRAYMLPECPKKPGMSLLLYPAPPTYLTLQPHNETSRQESQGKPLRTYAAWEMSLAVEQHLEVKPAPIAP
jgi:hypothetical protein